MEKEVVVGGRVEPYLMVVNCNVEPSDREESVVVTVTPEVERLGAGALVAVYVITVWSEAAWSKVTVQVASEPM